MAFPALPTNGQQVTVNNVIYQFDITKHAWVRLHNSTAANLISANYVTVVNSLTSSNIFAGQYYWANGTPFVSSTYGNTEVGAYLLVNSTITGLQANAAFQANLIDVLSGNAATQGSLLDVLVANAAVQSANLAYLLSNAATQEASLTSLVSNAAAQSSAIDTINANVGAYQIYANATFTTYSNTNVAGYLAGNITTGNVSATGYYFANGVPFVSSTYGNTEVSAYLPTYTGNLNPGNITASGNIVGGGVRTTTGSTPPTNPVPGDIWYDTASDLLFRYTDLGTSRRWLDVTGSTGFVNFYDNANVAAYLADTITVGNVTTTGKITGNLVPSANITYSLGEEWLRWKNLYLSGQTIFLGNSIITEDVALGTVTIIPPPTTEIPNPTAVVISSYGTISTANTADGQVVGNVSVTNNTTLSNVTVTGNISTNGAVTTTSIYTNNYFYSNGAPFVPTTGYINLSQTGSITSPYSGTARFYPPKNLTITRVNANLSDSPVGTPLTFIIKKNGTSIGTTFSIPTTSPVMTPVTVSVALTTTDYLTLDITGGSGSDLFVSIAYA